MRLPDWLGFRGKTLWDWLQLLIVPAILIAVTVFWSAQQTAKSDQRREALRVVADRAATEDARRDVTLKTYLDQMSGLMLDKGLLASRPRSAIRAVARTLTLTTLRRLDGERKAEVIRFLFEARLLNRPDPLVNLDFADLTGAELKDANLVRTNLTRARLVNADLVGANLAYADLERADLKGANLLDAYLRFANLEGANLADANLAGAYLEDANLGFANLQDANLAGADLRNADLHDASLTGAQLTGARNLNLYKFIARLNIEEEKAFLDSEKIFLDSLSPEELARFNLTPEKLAKLRREANGG